jgi:hypothetical protein
MAHSPRGSMQQEFRRSCIATGTIAAAAVCALLSSPVACVGGGCSAKPSIVVVFFPAGTPPDAVATFTASGACGPAPPPICQKVPTPDDYPCEAGVPLVWNLSVPAVASGACSIHVVRKDGQSFDDTVTVKCSSGSCGNQCVVDLPVNVSFASGDAGSAD